MMAEYSKGKETKFMAALGGIILSAVMTIMLAGCGDKPTYTISGKVTSGGSPLAGVTVTLSGGTAGTTSTDANGSYSFRDVSRGTYAVTPSLAGFVCSPPSRTVWLDGNDASGFDFSTTSTGKVATANHSVFLKNDGTVWTWGSNASGQLGDGTAANSAVPLPVGGLSGVMAVAAGLDFTVVLKNDGTVWTWGNNTSGQLGDGTAANSTVPVQVSGGLSGVTAVAAGFDHGMALKNDGTVWTWGNNASGQLGDGTTTNRAVPVQVTGLSGVKTIAGGSAYSMALKFDGTVWTWGNNTLGQLGVGNTTNSALPVLVGTLPNAIAMAAGKDFAIVLKNELTAFTVWTWGNNASGQLGNGTTTNSLTPVRAGSLSSVTAVAAGHDHALALLNDGTVWTWGNNGRGQLGNGTVQTSATPLKVGGLTGVLTLSGGNGYTLALRTDNQVWTWGKNAEGQLGDGTTTDSLLPLQVPSL